MKKNLFLVIPIFCATVAACSSTSVSMIGGALIGIADKTGLGRELCETKILSGLKENLQIETENAVNTVSQPGGYSNNPEIRIPLPETIKAVATILITMGLGSHLYAFELGMNLAAEKAAPKAIAIFREAIGEMTLSDAQAILKGKENEATSYFKEKTYNRLSTAYKPLVQEAMAEVGVTHLFQQINDAMNTIPLAGTSHLELEQYVSDAALEGLFTMLSKEEKKIHQGPAANVTQ